MYTFTLLPYIPRQVPAARHCHALAGPVLHAAARGEAKHRGGGEETDSALEKSFEQELDELEDLLVNQFGED